MAVKVRTPHLTLSRSEPLNVTRLPLWVRVLAVSGLPALLGCSVQSSLLLSTQSSAGGDGGTSGTTSPSPLAVSGAGPVTEAVVAVIDERPIGGASLMGGTTGGGTYAEAIAAGGLYYATTVEEIRAHLTGDTPSVILIAEGTYSFAATGKSPFNVCDVVCSPTTPVPSQVSVACSSTDSMYQLEDTHEFLRLGSNKTLIGLGRGAIFKNAQISIANRSNIILRNLSVEDLGQNIFAQGKGVNLWPGDHVWVDHCTFRNIGGSYFQISSTLGDGDVTDVETGYVTVTHNYFDGRMAKLCGGRARSVLGIAQVPALTLAHNWIDYARRYNVAASGPSTWAHVFNNLWSDVDQQGLLATCGAQVLSQGNVFQSVVSALTNSDSGSEAYCAAGLYGRLYAPMNTGTDEDNLVDSESTLQLASQPTDGAGMTKPLRNTGHSFTATAPTAGGTKTESYTVTLEADPNTVAAQVKAEAGAGKLF